MEKPEEAGRSSSPSERGLRLESVNTDGMDSSRCVRDMIAASVGDTAQPGGDQDATTVAVDLAKDIVQVALANRAGRIIDHKRLTRRQFERFLDTVTVGTEMVMESCGTAHSWGRRAQGRGLRVRLLPVQYVGPDVRRNKTDRRVDSRSVLTSLSAIDGWVQLFGSSLRP